MIEVTVIQALPILHSNTHFATYFGLVTIKVKLIVIYYPDYREADLNSVCY